jgi:hypothetical protein
MASHNDASHRFVATERSKVESQGLSNGRMKLTAPRPPSFDPPCVPPLCRATIDRRVGAAAYPRRWADEGQRDADSRRTPGQPV